MNRRIALVTGASRGIGRAVAMRIAEDGYHVIINYKENDVKADEVEKSIKGKGGSCERFKADVSDFDCVKNMFEYILGEYSRIDVLVNNAGIAKSAQIQDISPEWWGEIFATNVNGTFHCCKLAAPSMISAKSGCIINIASIWGVVGASCESDYSATKGAILAFSKALAKELGYSGIRVNVIAPGAVDTDMLSQLPPEAIDAAIAETPAGRIAKPHEIGELAAFLISDKAEFINGQVISPNGGFVII